MRAHLEPNRQTTRRDKRGFIFSLATNRSNRILQTGKGKGILMAIKEIILGNDTDTDEEKQEKKQFKIWLNARYAEEKVDNWKEYQMVGFDKKVISIHEDLIIVDEVPKIKVRYKSNLPKSKWGKWEKAGAKAGIAKYLWDCWLYRANLDGIQMDTKRTPNRRSEKNKNEERM